MIFFDLYKDHPMYKEDINYIRSHTIVTEISHIDQLAYGILVKDEEDYQFLADFLLSNQDVIDSCTSLYLNSYSRKVQVKQYQRATSMFSVDGVFFLPSLVVCVVLVFIIFACGVTYELRKKPGRYVLGRNSDKASKKKSKMKKKCFRLRRRKKDIILSTTKEEPVVATVGSNAFDKV